MAYIPHRVSLLDLIAERLRGTTMSDWLKLAITLIGVGIITWSTVQNLEYRMTKLESGFDEHLDKHDTQYDNIQKTMTQIQIELTRQNRQ